jgi:MFS family permease
MSDEPTPKERSGISRLFGHAVVDTKPLRVPAFRRMLIGQGTSFIGSMLTQVAVPVQVYEITKSSLYVGFVGLAGLVPIVIFGLYGGAIADAVDRRKLFLVSSLLTWTVTLLLLLQTLLNLRSVALILTLVVLQGAGFATASATRGAIIPRVVPVELVPAANTLNFTVNNVGQVLGPVVAGVLIGLSHGYAYAYGADALLFTAALYSTLRLPAIPPSHSGPRPGLRSVYDGLKFIATNPILVMSFAVDITAMVLAMPRALFPEAAATRFHGGIGILYSSIAIGAVLGGMFSGWIGKVHKQGRALTFAVLGWGIAIALGGFAHQLWIAVIVLIIAGGADLVSAVYRQTILQTYAPDEMRGRMQGVFTAVVAGGPRLGDVRAGVLASTTTLTVSWSGGGIACVVVVLIAALSVRSFWNFDTRQLES